MDVAPFSIAVPDDVLDDLGSRLRSTRWPDREVVDDWSQGVPLAYVREVCAYWADQYDWRRREALLNRLPQFTTSIDDMKLHFVHARSPHADAIPLLLSHGWPGSIVEFHKVVAPLTDPVAHGATAADAFHVVAPSLPGFGFSDKPTVPGWGVQKIATTFATLMRRLGYDRYVAQGGDWGSAITAALGADDTEHCRAVHMTLAMGVRPEVVDDPSPEELHALERMKEYRDWDSGYSTQQATRPQTLGYGLMDSPAAQAAWILEKFWKWTDCDGHPENVLTRDELLDNVMMYWVPGTGASSARLYWESFRRGGRSIPTVPTGFAVFPHEVVPPVRPWIEQQYPNLVHWATYDRGGHFAAFEVPDLFVAELRSFFGPLRSDVIAGSTVS